MSEKQDLVPVFIPPLATMFAQAEKIKKAPLTETEVVRLRDKASCIMMEAADADEMTAKRGYVDVNPETCWSDWHRLRVEFTGNGYLPKIVMCMVGPADFAERATPILSEGGVEHEFRGRDDRMPRSFSASVSPNQSSWTDEDTNGVQRHGAVLYFLSKNFGAAAAPEQSANMLHLGKRLLDVGGLAMKCESAGIAHGKQRWLDLIQAIDHKTANDVQLWSALFDAYVQLPIGSGDELYTCGMHLLGRPDLIVANPVMQTALQSDACVDDAIDLFRGFALYQLAECPVGAFGSGHTFSLGAGTPRFRVVWETCTGYDEDEFFFNPFGRWRFVGM